MIRIPRAPAIGMVVAVSVGAAYVESTALTAPTQTQATQPGRANQRSSPAATERPLVDQYCISCHNERLKTAGLVLEKQDVNHPAANPELWEKVVRKLTGGAMPPAGAPRPDAAAVRAFTEALVAGLDEAAAASPNPGRAAAHRMNRIEYVNTIRDLLALEIDGRALLPADTSSYGFDNNADILSMSPALLDRYMSAATKISRMAIGDPAIRPVVDRYKVSQFLRQDDRMSDDLPFGTNGGQAVRHTFPLDGEYVLSISLLGRLHTQVHQLDVWLDRALIKRFSLRGKSAGAPVGRRGYGDLQDLTVRFVTQAGTRTIGVAFVAEPAVPEGVRTKRPSVYESMGAADSRSTLAVDVIKIDGPYNATVPKDTPSRRRIFVCQQHDTACATKILSTLARRAYRRPITNADVKRLLGFYATGLKAGGFDVGIGRAVEALLVDPEFLFRIEREPAEAQPGSLHRVSELDLASRLSFFLWSSIPDEELLTLAEQRKLHEPAVLAQQARRLLDDPRSKNLVTNFGEQWLHLRNMASITPDPVEFPDFDENLKQAMAKETELFLESQIREDRSVLDLLTAKDTFLNGRLAQHYGVPNVYGSHFRRVTLNDEKRYGLLGKGSVLTVTSYAHRTSPTLRGKWVLDNLLGAPPPAPPPNTPALKETETNSKPTSVRERLEAHRRNPFCASCHARMDPLGLVMENFNAIGVWRTSDAGRPIDPTTILPDGTKLDGPMALRNALLHRNDEFVTNVAEKLLTFALGRGLEYYDAPVVRQIVRDTRRQGDRWSALILSIVQSQPFRMARVSESAARPRAGEGRATAQPGVR